MSELVFFSPDSLLESNEETATMKTKSRVISDAIVTVLASAMLSSAAWSLENGERVKGPKMQLEEVVVTAQHRESNLSELAMSATALSGSHLSDMGVTDITDILETVPNVQLRTLASGQSFLTIRGVRGREINSSTVGYYIDDIPIASHQGQPGLMPYDMNRVEILRGPQGTLHGEGSMGGAVRFFTNAPELDNVALGFESNYRSTKSGGTGYDISGLINLPVVEDRFAIRVVASRSDNDGWVDAPDRFGGPQSDINDFQRDTLRVRALYQLSESLSVSASVFSSDTDSGGWAESDANLRTTATSLSGQVDDVDLYALSLVYESEAVVVTSNTAKYERYNIRSADTHGFIPIVNGIYGLFGVPAIGTMDTDIGTDESVVTQEFRVLSAGDRNLDWVVGLYYKDSEVLDITMATGDNPQPPAGFEIYNATLQFEVEELAAYGEATYEFSDSWDLTAGLRYFREERYDSGISGGIFTGSLPGAPLSVISESAEVDLVLPKINVSWHLNEKSLLWATAAKGFRSSGANPYAVLSPLASPTFDSDSLWSYEIGGRMRSEDGRFALEGAAYYIDWEDYQVIIDRIGGIFAVFGNDPQGATLHGIEAQVTSFIGDALQVTASGSYIDSELESTGTQLSFVPEFSWQLSAQYSRPVTDVWDLVIHAGVYYQDDRWEDDANTNLLDAYTKIDFRAGLESERWSVYLFGDNMSDEDIQYSMGPNHLIRGRPATYGLTVRGNF